VALSSPAVASVTMSHSRRIRIAVPRLDPRPPGLAFPSQKGGGRKGEGGREGTRDASGKKAPNPRAAVMTLILSREGQARQAAGAAGGARRGGEYEKLAARATGMQ